MVFYPYFCNPKHTIKSKKFLVVGMSCSRKIFFGKNWQAKEKRFAMPANLWHSGGRRKLPPRNFRDIANR